MIISKETIVAVGLLLSTLHAQNVIRQSCGVDFFRCQNGKCIEGYRRCDRVVDCPDNEDEAACECRSDEFQCQDDGSCIESRKRCDGINHCKDGSDEYQCTAKGYFRCRGGKLIPENARCNRQYDCDPGDYSDELNCPCGDNDFKCDNGYCIPRSKQCDRTHDCQDGSDERDCTYGSICMAYQYKCSSGQCVKAEARCNGTVDCDDGSDEKNCPCKRGQFQCRDGSCINFAQRCNGHRDCRPSGEDENNCGVERCSPESFTCDRGSSVPCATICDGNPECDNGEDEDGCPDCPHKCDGRCLEEIQVCNKIPDCSDASDEINCNTCDGPTDFRCRNGECIKASQRCNTIKECVDGSDELQCNDTMITGPTTCNEDQYQCLNGICIDIQFFCDRNPDCTDNSDEENCPCDEGYWQCRTGQCIRDSEHCDGTFHCSDGSDEYDCPTTYRPFTTTYPYTQPPVTQPPYYLTTTSAPLFNPYVPDNRAPVALSLQTYPVEQTVRNGGDVVFSCRDEGLIRAPVRWVREGGRSLKPGSVDRNGRLEMNHVTTADSGIYICQAPKYLGSPGSELRVTLYVESSSVTFRPSFITCQYDEATCGNGQCIPKSAVCDRKIDCDDGSDEDTCGQNGLCQPNEYQCANHKCVLKTWFCDSDDDCGDGSDEINCPTTDPHQNCSRVEYACKSNDQCIPRSFHCDGQSDCLDKSDETGCASVHVTRPPQPTNVRLNPGDTLTLVCEAVGVPTPLISWRLNWGHVPKKCTSTSENGIGRLTCPNMQTDDSGAYSCEAINNIGTVFAIPDSIVYVNRTEALCPSGYFNSEARSQNECIRCFCFGESTSCKSADLFTYNMPTPLGEGGTRLLGATQSFNGDVKIDKQQTINNQYYYQPLRNGATVTKLEDYSQTFSRSSAHPYLTLPETYNGNQLTSYGGHIKYRLSPHNPQPYGYNENVPDVVIIGKYQTLIHQYRGDRGRDLTVDARLTPDNWMKPSPRGLIAVTREDIMMALDAVDMILLRVDLNNAGVNITDFTMESAQHINVGLGSASLVEECSCPPGYEGLSCQKCASGFARESNGPWLGSCVAKRACPPGTYGDPNSGGDCRPCPCPLTNRENQFARTCSLGPSGIVICDCNPGYEGNDCSRCAPNYFGNPLIPGDSCKPRPSDNCNALGTAQVRLPDECVCKDNVQGRYCDQCKSGTFFLSPDSRDGCASCFCSGVSQQCMSSNLRRKTTMVRFNVPQIVGQVKLYKSAPFGSGGSVRYNAPIETDAQPELFRGEMSISGFDRTQPSIYYWSLPASFAGDKVTSYGGYLSYELRHVPGSQGSRNNAADVQLISDNSLTFNYFGSFTPDSDGYLNASIQLLEKGWQRPDGKEVSREHFLLALADVKTILIKATYTTNIEVASVVSASIETAKSGGDGRLAQHVEQCVCPGGYMGTSCEDCAPGFTRISSGLYLEHCGPCDCNGHSSMCNPETGVCFDCTDNTAGPNCENCREGYERDIYNNCVPRSSNTPAPCNCDPRGEEIPCDGSGYCTCKQNVEGEKCGRCREGTFGLDAANPLGCLSCYCSGVTNNCHEASHFARIPIAAPIFGENYGGYTLTDLNGQLVINDQFVPAPDESELMYMFSSPPQEELYWSLPVFPGNRVLSYGGTLSLTQKFQTGGYSEESVPGNDVILFGDEISVYWSNPTPIRSGESLGYQVPLQEGEWFILNTPTPASRRDFMSVLKNLRRVLVRATLSDELLSTAISDVSMDTASELSDSSSPVAKSVEICICPEGYSGTSCETCNAGYYKDQNGQCKQCNCNGHDCQLNSYDEVICNCRPPYIGPDCSTVGGEPSIDQTTRPVPPPQSTVTVTITSPTIKIEEVGSTVNFTCQAQSINVRGPLIVDWYKADGELPLDRTQFDQNTGMLRITNLQISDSGKYICQTTDGVSTNQAIATLKVPGNDMRLPTVSISPPIAEYYEGDRIELICTTTGNPAPRITWQRANNRPLPRTTQRYDALLVIEYANQDDSGEYRCIASNAAGSRDRTAVVTIRQRPSRPSYQELTVSSPTPTVDEGRSITVVCTGSTNVPAGGINWVRQDGTEFLQNVRANNGVLYIENARLENAGVYVCQTSAFGFNPALITLEVRPQGPPVETSNITLSVDHLRIPTGGSGTIDCTPQGYPRPLIKWTKHQDSFGLGTSQRENTLIISNAQDSDQGYYLCEGTVNNEPIVSNYVYVEIEKREAPRVVVYPQGENSVTLGSQYEIHCRVTGGIPTPVITWDKNRGQLSPHVEIQQNNNVLSFQTVEVNDEGTYTCTATNEAGSSSASAIVKVRSPPEITITPSNFIQVIKGDKVDVECRADGYPEPTVSIRLADREFVPSSPRIAVLSISYVNERHEGVYTCVATSVAGTVEEQFAIRVERGDGGFGNAEGSGEDEIGSEYQPDDENAPSSMIAIEGQESRLGCNASNEFQVVWGRADRSPLQNNARQYGSELIIYNTSKADSGRYECTLINRRTNEVQQSVYTSLQVMAVPRITLRPPSQIVHPGQSPTVECVVEGDDITSISWRPVDRLPSSRVEIRYSTLIFRQIEVEDAGKYECFAMNRIANATAIAEVIVNGTRDEAPALVSIDQPRRPFRVREKVEVLCRARSRNIRVSWERYNTNQYVETRTYGDGSLLLIPNVEQSDADVYRCTGIDSYGRQSSDDFVLEVVPVSDSKPYPINDEETMYTARLGDTIDLPCTSNLEEPVSIEWRREFSPLQPGIRLNERSLHLEGVTEADAGTYVCRVRNNVGRVETRATLRVVGIVPKFNGNGWLTLPTLRDAYMQFEIEVSFKPADTNGIILYNSQKEDGTGHYLVLQLVDGVPQFTLKFDAADALVTRGDRPLTLNAWHTIRLRRNGSKVTMDVDNTGPFSAESNIQYQTLDLYAPLYIGNAPQQRPYELETTSGFVGCVGMLILGKEEKNIMADSLERNNVYDCDSCTPNLCLNNGVCQEARNERGYICLCPGGFAGQNCDKTGEACRPGLCGTGKCTDTADGYRCACPVTFAGKNCDVRQNIEYPAFTGSAFLAIKPPQTSRYLKMSMKIKPKPPVTDGIIMYCAESSRGYGGFTSLTVRDGHLEFRYDLGDNTEPVVLTSNKTLQANSWTSVQIIRSGDLVSLTVDMIHNYNYKLSSPRYLSLETPLFVGGVDDSVVLNNNTGVVGGFSGCIKDVKLQGDDLNLINSSIQSANVQECVNYDRGDIPDVESICSQCRNGGYCLNADSTYCTCPSGFSGQYCEYRVPLSSQRQPLGNPCAAQPCRNGGTCKSDFSARMNYTCECPLGYAGQGCQMPLELLQSVGFNGNGYLELPASYLRYDQLEKEPAVIALAVHTTSDGVLLYQREPQLRVGGDYIFMKVNKGFVEMEWDMGSGLNSLVIDAVPVTDGESHNVIAKLYEGNRIELTVDGVSKSKITNGISNVMNADSNIYIGGIPDSWSAEYDYYPGLTGCIETVEFTGSTRGLRLGKVAVAGRNTQRCKDQMVHY